MAAVAAPTPSTDTNEPASPPSLWLASLMGGIYILAALAVVFYGVPELWKATVSNAITASFSSFVDVAGRILIQVAALCGLAYFGHTLAGSKPPVGLRGGIFLAISTLFTVFFLSRAVAMIIGRIVGLETTANLILWVISVAVFGFLGLRFLQGKRFFRWADNLEHGGWFSTASYKRNQGVRVRRLTILGLLFLFGSGVYTLMVHQLTGSSDWVITTPFLPAPLTQITLLPDVRFTVPLLLGALSIWLAIRAVNIPLFADFLIATEAEMNKVSWSTRAQLIRDTIVVLVVVLIITLFLFLVDIFWGWFLSRSFIAVLPTEEEQQSRKSKTLDRLDY